MATLVCNRYSYVESPSIVVQGDSEFIPDQAMTIAQIFERARLGLLNNDVFMNELPDDVPEFYDDLTDALIPVEDKFEDAPVTEDSETNG